MAKKVEVFEAKESFVTMLDGEQVSVAAGDLVRDGHPMLKGREDLFKPAENIIRFDVEQATAAPGEKRGESGAEPQEKPAASKKPARGQKGRS